MSVPPEIEIRDRPQARPVAAVAFATVLVLAAPAVVIAIATSYPTPHGDLNAVLLGGMLAAAALVGLAAAGAMSILRFRLVGDSASLTVGLALTFIALLLVGVGLVLPLLDSTSADAIALRGLVAGAAYTVTATVALLVVVALRQSEHRLSSAALFTFATLAVLTCVAVALLDSAEFTAHTASYLIPAEGALLTPPLIGIWFALAVLLLRPSLRRRREVLPWFGLALMSIAFAEVLAREVAFAGDTWSVGRASLVVLAAVMALNGVATDLGQAFREQARSLQSERRHREEALRRHEQHLAAEEEALHDASSSILAIQGAARVLEASEDGMAPEQRRAMMAALGDEVDRLHRIIERSPRSDPMVAFDVASAIQSVVSVRRLGRSISFDPGVGVRAIGRSADLAEVVQNLVDNAFRHGDGPVEITVQQSDGTVHVGVHDRGPGVPDEVRGRIFERGVTTHDAGSGLGLFICQQLMRQQGGDLWVEARPGGGASFLAALPAAENFGVSLSAVADAPMQGTG